MEDMDDIEPAEDEAAEEAPEAPEEAPDPSESIVKAMISVRASFCRTREPSGQRPCALRRPFGGRGVLERTYR